MVRTRSRSLILASTLATMPTLAHAEAAKAGKQDSSGDIVVTAQRREQRLQDVPMAVSALKSEDLERIGFKDLGDLSEAIPSLAITPYPNGGSSLVVFMRGVGQVDSVQIARDPGVGIYLDDIYLGRSVGLATDVAGVSRVEVLRGPQGTLYGRNTIGGAVKLITEPPSGKLGLKQTVDFGNFDYLRSTTTVDLPSVGDFSARLTYINSTIDGWVKNAGSGGNFGAKDQEAYRAAIRWTPSDRLSVDYAFDHADQDGVTYYEQRQYSYPLFPFAFPLDPSRRKQSYRPVDLPLADDFTTNGHALTANWDISDDVSLKSITSYRELKSKQLSDTVEAFNVFSASSTLVEQNQFSQELLLNGAIRPVSLDYTLGAYYFKEDGHQETAGLANPFFMIAPPTIADFGPLARGDVKNESKAIFGNLDWKPPILDGRLSVILGGRYSWDDRAANRIVDGFPLSKASAKTNFTSFDPSLTIDYRWTSDVHTYVRVARGYRTGGFNIYNAALSPFAPEKLISYEVGLKSQFWDRRGALNIALFHQDYSKIQLDFVDPATSDIFTVNAGDATFDGVEIDGLFRLVQGLTLRADASYLDSKQDGATINPFTAAPVLGTSLPNAPKWKYNIGLEYAFPPTSLGAVAALIGYSYRGNEYSNGGPGTKGDPRPDYELLRARVTLSEVPLGRGHVSAALWGENLLDEDYQTYHNYGAVIFGAPHTYGLTLTYQY